MKAHTTDHKWLLNATNSGLLCINQFVKAWAELQKHCQTDEGILALPASCAGYLKSDGGDTYTKVSVKLQSKIQAQYCKSSA